MPVLLSVMVMNHARFAMRGATSSAAMRDALEGAANHAHPVLKKSARLAAPTQSATCRVPLRAIGCHARSDARDFCDAVTNVRLSAVQTARARCIVRCAHQTRSKTFELTLLC
jgi:hypothetical protein